MELILVITPLHWRIYSNNYYIPRVPVGSYGAQEETDWIESATKRPTEKARRRQHHEVVVRQRYEDDKQKLERMSEAEMTTKDKEIVKQLDQLLEEQQSVLEQASVPFFFVTNQKESIQLQMGVLEVTQRVALELGY